MKAAGTTAASVALFLLGTVVTHGEGAPDCSARFDMQLPTHGGSAASRSAVSVSAAGAFLRQRLDGRCGKLEM
ncbi:MAG TPA: hypothetical protein VMU81_08625 [Acetobacteraceae bacterium]|jgi:hypothetical protein|nr:hypothetical protein [Acetobacteraceae bacterium]